MFILQFHEMFYFTEFEENTEAQVWLFQTQRADSKLVFHTFWLSAMKRKVTSAPRSLFSPFRRPIPSFLKLSKYARGTLDRWTLISLAIWPQFVFLANEADYWGRLMTLKSIWSLLLCVAIWILQRDVSNNGYWICLRPQVRTKQHA